MRPIYETYLGPEASDLPASGLLYPLKIWNPENPDVELVRTLLGVDRASRSLVLAGHIPQGWHAQLMQATIDDLIIAAEDAGRIAKSAMNELGLSPALGLFVSWVGRRMLLGQRTEEEVEAVASLIGEDVSLGGFYSYGEISPHAQSVAGLHNQTVTLTLMAETP